MTKRKTALKLPTPGIQAMLDIQTALLDHPQMPDSLDVNIEAKAEPAVPAVYVRTATGQVLVSIMPMRNNRLRVTFAKISNATKQLTVGSQPLYVDNDALARKHDINGLIVRFCKLFLE